MPSRRGPSLPAGATPADLPASLAPELAVQAARPQPGEWIYEIKFDGYRMLARVDGPDVRFFSRNGRDWTAKLQHLRAEMLRMKLPQGWYDGEIVVQGSSGVPDFNALQNAFGHARASAIQFYLFDVPFLAGHDLRRCPVEARRAALKGALGPSEWIRFSEEFVAPAGALVATACEMGLEGIIGKRRGSAYASARTGDWIKLKCTSRQEFVIGGYTRPDSRSSGVGALLVGYFDDDNMLQYAGKVGTGFTDDTLAQLQERLGALGQTARPFATPTGHDRRASWVRPELVCEVSYAEWPEGRHLRHPSFKGLRQDKIAAVVRRDVPVAAPAQPERVVVAAKPRPRAKVRLEAPLPVKVTNAERVIDPSTGITKADLVRYYAEVAPWMLAHLAGRPAYIRRAPEGIDAATIFQQHPEGMGFRPTDPALWPGHEPAIAFESAADLVAGAQLGMVEIHTWNSTAADILHPDRVIFDLDPGEGVPWDQVKEAAHLTRAVLDELGLASWLKTSGGKGLHVVVPLQPLYGYDRVKAFSKAVVEHMASVVPERFVAKPGARNRVGKVFIDYLRNGQSQSTAAAFTARARPGLGVSMPLDWKDLGSLAGGAQWTVSNAVAHLRAHTTDPWGRYWSAGQQLTAALTAIGLPADEPPPKKSGRRR